MSVGHLLFAAVATAYMLVAVLFEERDLVGHFGDAYRRYQESTPAVSPAPGPQARMAPGQASSRNCVIERSITGAERSSAMGQ